MYLQNHFCLVFVKMRNLPGSVHLVQELSILRLMARMQQLGALYIQGIGGRQLVLGAHDWRRGRKR